MLVVIAYGALPWEDWNKVEHTISSTLKKVILAIIYVYTVYIHTCVCIVTTYPTIYLS